MAKSKKEIVSKKDQVIALVKAEDYKKALGIAKTFVRDFDKEEQRTIQIAHETLTGKGGIYTMMKIDTDKMVEDAKILLKKFSEEKSK
jgi:hypothetical protein